MIDVVKQKATNTKENKANIELHVVDEPSRCGSVAKVLETSELRVTEIKEDRVAM